MEESEMRKFRILALVLALLVILPAVVACKKTTMATAPVTTPKKLSTSPLIPQMR